MRKLVHMWLPDQAPEWFRRALPENYPLEVYDPKKEVILQWITQ